jgi:CRISPR-associated protein Csb2
MFALEVEYLAGRSVATARHDRDTAEWPPHPGRLFCALVAACYEGDLTEEEREAGRSALLWLEGQHPPAISVSEATHRDVLPLFVPVNDKNDQCKIDAKKKVKFHPTINGEIAIRRGRQERTFPSVTPARPILHFVWTPAEGVESYLPALARLAACVTYLGHSSSLVRVSVADAPGPITHVPAEGGDHIFRVPATGRLEELERAYRRQARPSPGTYQAYRLVSGEEPLPSRPAESVFGDLIVCQIDGRSFLPLSGALRLTDAIRQAVLKATDRSGPQVKSLVSGHTDAGGVSRADHVAYVPLANVGHRHADGKVMGFAVVLPRSLGRFSPERREILSALAGLEAVGIDGHTWAVTLVGADAGFQSLRTDTYTAESAFRRKRSRRWASVTPVLCDRFPKDKDGERIENVIADSVERVVGCRPIRVAADRVSRFRGVPTSVRFHRERKEADVPRYRTHAVVEFDREIRGPLIVGAGRFLGLGLFRVWEPDREGTS